MKLFGATVPFLLVLVKSVRQSQPHFFMHENVKGFPIEEIKELLPGVYVQPNSLVE